MGKIVCFTQDNDVGSTLVKLALEKREIPFVEVSISRHPSKYEGLKSLTFCESLPQVFFNTRLIGGLEETARQLESWDKDKKYKSAKAKYEAQFIRMGEPGKLLHLIPTQEEQDGAKGENEKVEVPRLSIELPDGTKTSVVDITERLKNTLPREDHTLNHTQYKNAFTGVKATQVFCDSMELSSDEAICFGQHLLDSGVICLLGGGSSKQANEKRFVADKASIYRLHCLSTPRILNSYYVCTNDKEGHEPRDVGYLMDYVRDMDKFLTLIEMGSCDKDKGKIDYAKAAAHLKFPEFEYKACRLQLFDLQAFQTRQELVAFAINVYKVMLRYAFIKVGIGQTENDRLTLLQNVKFNVGGYEYSFREWLDGILRGNQKSNQSHKPPFWDKNDERSKFCRLTSGAVDYRIHFAVNQDVRFGSSLGLPFSTFTSENVEEELGIAARIFLSDKRNMDLDASRDLGLPRLVLGWYRCDFGGAAQLEQTIYKHLNPSQQPLFRGKLESAALPSSNHRSHKKYKCINSDWTRNAFHYVSFDKKSLKSEIKGAANLLLRRFIKPTIPAVESLRLATLHSLNMLDTLPEERFDRITKMVKEEFDVPIVLISLVDENRQWFKSKQWTCENAPAVDQTTRDIAFCGHAILRKRDEVFVVENALEDDRFAENPQVTGPLGLRFYAGCNLSIPSTTADAFSSDNEEGSEDGAVNVGTLCLKDTKPRKFTEADEKKLRMYAHRVNREIARRQQNEGSDYLSSTCTNSTEFGSVHMSIQAE